MGELAMPKPGDLIAGKYRIDSLIGEGGMGAVFSATHALTAKRVAVKWMLPASARNEEAVQRLLREASAAGRIDHPNVVDVYDVGEHDGAPFLVMELLHGETLNEALDRGALGVPEILQTVLGAVHGVAAAHRTGVIHRDMKPDNIFVCRDESGAWVSAKVLDFGISKVSSTHGVVNPRLTKTGAVIGTPYYMSPEQIRGASEVDGRVDVYAFGVILYEALTGRVPFDGKTYSALVLEIATGTPRRPCDVNPRLPVALERIVLKAMAREPDQRYRDLESLAHAIEQFTRGAANDPDSLQLELNRTSSTVTTPFAAEAPPVVPVSKAPTYVAIGTVLALLGAGFFAWWSGRSEVAEAPHVASQPASAPEAEPQAEPQAAPLAVPQTLTAAPPPAPVPAPSAAAPIEPAPERDLHRPAQQPRPSAPSHTAAAPAPASAAPTPQLVVTPAAPPSRPRGTGRSGAIAADEF